MIEYDIKELEDPTNRPNKKYYARPVHNNTHTLEDMEKFMVKSSTLSRAEIRGVIISMVDYITDSLTSGNSIKINDLGTFFLRCQSEGKSTPGEVSAKDFKNITVGFKTDATFRKTIVSECSFKKKAIKK